MGTARIELETHPCAEVPVVWPDVRAFDLSWRQSDDYVGYEGASPNWSDKHEVVGHYISQRPILWPPHILFESHCPVFTDGRHRTARLREHGAAAIPIACDPERVDELRTVCGTALGETFSGIRTSTIV